MTTAVCPGSFDPVTLGHLDVIKRATALFDKVIVVVMVNSSKKPTFTAEERVDLLKRATASLKNVEIDTYEGLLADYTALRKATAVVKGLRVMSDFEYEFQMALTNMSLTPGVETIFLPASIDCMFLSSSMVREVAKHGRNITPFVPEGLAKDISAKLTKEG
ncbi:MAG TPA: pantetheine-phosphate adenylyltransferase [Ruminiclostridium sp.]|nr:pantetheine-phosphate adenylyltransferase [Ruminiclostridium sp.]